MEKLVSKENGEVMLNNNSNKKEENELKCNDMFPKVVYSTWRLRDFGLIGKEYSLKIPNNLLEKNTQEDNGNENLNKDKIETQDTNNNPSLNNNNEQNEDLKRRELIILDDMSDNFFDHLYNSSKSNPGYTSDDEYGKDINDIQRNENCEFSKTNNALKSLSNIQLQEKLALQNVLQKDLQTTHAKQNLGILDVKAGNVKNLKNLFEGSNIDDGQINHKTKRLFSNEPTLNSSETKVKPKAIIKPIKQTCIQTTSPSISLLKEPERKLDSLTNQDSFTVTSSATIQYNSFLPPTIFKTSTLQPVTSDKPSTVYKTYENGIFHTTTKCNSLLTTTSSSTTKTASSTTLSHTILKSTTSPSSFTNVSPPSPMLSFCSSSTSMPPPLINSSSISKSPEGNKSTFRSSKIFKKRQKLVSKAAEIALSFRSSPTSLKNSPQIFPPPIINPPIISPKVSSFETSTPESCGITRVIKMHKTERDLTTKRPKKSDNLTNDGLVDKDLNDSFKGFESREDVREIEGVLQDDGKPNVGRTSEDNVEVYVDESVVEVVNVICYQMVTEKVCGNKYSTNDIKDNKDKNYRIDKVVLTKSTLIDMDYSELRKNILQDLLHEFRKLENESLWKRKNNNILNNWNNEIEIDDLTIERNDLIINSKIKLNSSQKESLLKQLNLVAEKENMIY